LFIGRLGAVAQFWLSKCGDQLGSAAYGFSGDLGDNLP